MGPLRVGLDGYEVNPSMANFTYIIAFSRNVVVGFDTSVEDLLI